MLILFISPLHFSLSAPFVKPAGHEFAVVDFVRRSLVDGAIPFVAFPFDRSLLASYTAHGVARGGADLSKQAIEEWWPKVDDCCQYAVASFRRGTPGLGK